MRSLATADRQLVDALHAAASVLEEPTIAVLVPVLSRPHRVAPLLRSFAAATCSSDAKLYFIAQRSDAAELAALRTAGVDPILVEDTDRSWAKKINRGYEQTTEPWLLLGADDLAFHPGWIDAVRVRLQDHPGVIGTNDLGNGATMAGTHSTHPFVRRLYADVCGTADARHRVVHEGYDHNFTDTELVATAMQRGLYVHAVDCVIEHLHPAWGKAPRDATYVLGRRRVRQDRALFEQRGRTFGW